MESRVNVSRRVLGVLGAVFVLPVVVVGALFAYLRFHDSDVANDPDPIPITIPPPISLVPGLKVMRDIEYGRVGAESLRLDVYQSTEAKAAAVPRPAILLIHGGGWIEGDKENEALFASLLVPRGFVAFAINYRLVRDDSSRYPAAVLDVRRAARWVRAHAAEFGADPQRLGAVGLSAGGHLAALLGTTDALDPTDRNSGRWSARVECVVDTAGPTDFTDDKNAPTGPRIAAVIPLFFGSSRQENPDAYRAASPALLVDAQTAPTLIIHGTADETVPIGQSERFDRALTKAGIDHRFVVLDGEGHAFLQLANQQRWLDEMGNWLVGHLKP